MSKILKFFFIKMKSGVLIFVISILLFTFTSCHENFDEDDDIPIIDFNVDHSNYVDPFDMFNYDPIAIKQSDRKLKRKLEKDVIATKEHGTLCGEKLFLKRLVQILFSTMQLKVCNYFTLITLKMSLK